MPIYAKCSKVFYGQILSIPYWIMYNESFKRIGSASNNATISRNNARTYFKLFAVYSFGLYNNFLKGL